MMADPEWSPRDMEGWHARVEGLATAHRAHRHDSGATENALGDAMITAMDKGEIELAACLALLRQIRHWRGMDRALTVLNNLAADLDGHRRN